ncbi:RagB/SusD family nutrient uptake outer membrane protein [Pinibacter aurantiacus]|uniref:RagB/SusD family nutrient uptake outer membrane protein n=1 Tax=Pinibacter aurantiacus TaxID=2851599 RepID=A0A9E2W4Q6_9BACT|nr:RagB/SusD family nutrient uptake outer membrane protein [Pinibacter aurantiacus]MBV4360045.1 RagB/SusD family nutrient uptake outer membrane protein [Pinibacter aurantiacus]
MKKSINIALIVLSVVGLFGCKKFLSELPDNRVDMDNPSNITVDNISAILVNAYPKANYMGFCEAMSDNVDDKLGGSLVLSNFYPYQFADANNNHSQDMPTAYWDECYKAIALCNQALEAIGKATNPKTFNAQKGEALVARAYAHFMLVNLFAKTYDPATASTDPGVPYATKPETIVFGQYTRGTVASTYDSIRNDLLTGISLISDDSYTVPKYHFTKAATNAFATRFYLFKQQYDSAVIFASKVFPSGDFASNMRPWLTTYRKLTYYALQQQYTQIDQKANLLLVETLSNWANSFYAYRFGFTPALQTTILGKNIANGYYPYMVYGNSQVLNIPKFYPHFVQTGLNANTGYNYTTIPLFTTEEVLLNRAEAYAKQQQYGLALADLNTFASQRIFNGYDANGDPIPFDPAKNTITIDSVNKYYPKGDIQTKVITAILDFKRAEFLFEGSRWFDILRYKMEVKHKYMVSNSKTDSTVLKVDDKRRLIQLPDAAVLSGLALNPRDSS